jgi:hypothetical protein
MSFDLDRSFIAGRETKVLLHDRKYLIRSRYPPPSGETAPIGDDIQGDLTGERVFRDTFLCIW